MLIDAHSHLDMYGSNLDQALAEIDEHRILTLAVSMDQESYSTLRAIEERSEYVIATFGIHPWRAAHFDGDLDQLAELTAQSPMIGEIGLDFHWQKDRASYREQRVLFDHLMSLAGSQGKPVNLHTKGAEEEILRKLEEYGIPSPIVHWYSGPLDLIDRYAAAGAYFTISVDLGYSDHARSVLQAVPESRLLTETDNPGGYRWRSGAAGMPRLIEQVVADIAVLKKLTPAEVRELVAANFERATACCPRIREKWALLEDRPHGPARPSEAPRGT